MKTILAKFLFFLGDFSAMGDLPKVYEHCKATEDPDMTLIDFITDHLINIDEIFDKHQIGDDQKPHNDIDFKLGSYIPILFIQEFKSYDFKTSKITIESDVVISNYKKSFYSFKHILSVFHPPIFA
jgi:hypothetical protein